MTAAEVLSPTLDLLTEDYVLVQAWKKTARHIRYHNWYSDTLELDRAAVDLPRFLSNLSRDLSRASAWVSDDLRLVPAPKSQSWRVSEKGEKWAPADDAKAKLRPLAHVSLRDQVAATAVMLCLADSVETLQGDPRASHATLADRRRVISYGNRLFCDSSQGALHHRWGSAKLYRSYYQDYRTFIGRPEAVASTTKASEGARMVVVHLDLRQFYDRVRPSLLRDKLLALPSAGADPRFLALATSLLDWRWSGEDEAQVSKYARESEIADFRSIALPQGLVAAGFFANVVLLDCDRALSNTLDSRIAHDVHLVDVCRYVDDLRVVVAVESGTSLDSLKQSMTDWLAGLLVTHAPGLEPNGAKTEAAVLVGGERLLVRQSNRMNRIQTAVSGGFDAIAGAQILESVQGLLRAQERYSKERASEDGWSLTPVPDVRDATIARFAAGRFRTTYRSLRPLLPFTDSFIQGDSTNPEELPTPETRGISSRQALDDDARSFSLGLIEHWVNDPSNIRLLRIALDLWPDALVLTSVLELLRPLTMKATDKSEGHHVAWYCIAELFRAAATETGVVEEYELLPEGSDLKAYREVLLEEAERLLSGSPTPLPWFVRQQILLFCAAFDPARATRVLRRSTGRVDSYVELVQYLSGDLSTQDGADLATLALVVRRAFLTRDGAVDLALEMLPSAIIGEVCKRDLAFGAELLASRPELARQLSETTRRCLCLPRVGGTADEISLGEIVLLGGPQGPLRREPSLLRFATKFLSALAASDFAESITPSDVFFRRTGSTPRDFDIDSLRILRSVSSEGPGPYSVPAWATEHSAWKFQLGYLLRFILCGQEDYTRSKRADGWRESTGIYRPADGHWQRRLFGLYNAFDAFGDDWLPISGWIEETLSTMLRWPGSHGVESSNWVDHGLRIAVGQFKKRFDVVSAGIAQSGGLLLLTVRARRPHGAQQTRPLRGCVVQTVLPTATDFARHGITVSDPRFRSRHRNHLAAALAAVERMLHLRETHEARSGRLDLLILPELAVHPTDVAHHLLPFARLHKTIILTGLTYEDVFGSQPLVNSALWIVPEWSSSGGIQFRIRRQGKLYLAPLEQSFNQPTQVLQGFRPCQWLVEYDWSHDPSARPLTLTASVCYDATDLNLAAALRQSSDVLAIPALNRDINTFDQMAQALHYHMYQMVVVANNGVYGGSNAYSPYKDAYARQVFHLHGQPQASVGFFEIDDIAGFLSRKDAATHLQAGPPGAPATGRAWKSPPAGYL